MRLSLCALDAALPSVSDLADMIEEINPEAEGAEALELAYMTRSVLLDLFDAMLKPTRSPACSSGFADWLQDGEEAEARIRSLVEEGLMKRYRNAALRS